MKSSSPPQVSPTPRTKVTRRRANDPTRKIQLEEVILPQAIEAEKQLLGFLFCFPDYYPKAIEAGFTSQLLQTQTHKILFAAMADIVSKGWALNPMTLQEYLKTQHLLEKIGGPGYLAELMDLRAIGPSSISGLIQNLKDIDYKCQVVKKAVELQRVAGNGASPSEIEDILEGVPRTHNITQHYSLTPAGLIYRKPARFGFGFEIERLTNFGAKVTQEMIEDDGSSEEQRIFELEVSLKGETRRVEVPASKFDAMQWPTAMLGAEAIIYPGKADHAKCAIKTLSPLLTKRTVYAHTGWRQIGERWCYLHGSGAITGDGNLTDVAVRLPHSLRFFSLPEPARGEDIIGAYQVALDLLDAFPRHLTVPLLGAIIASVMGDPDYSVYITGQSGCFKSEITGIAMSFFGQGFNRLTMPANWDDTGNALLSKAFTAKDAAFAIDDFAPNGQKRHDEELHAKAERVFRAAGNRTGRGRLQSDMTERAAKEPRGLIISSGEDLPRGMSLQARLLIVPIEKGEIESDALTVMQQAAASGKFATSLATFLSFLARTHDKIKAQFDKDRISYRDKLAKKSDGHARQATTTAHLAGSWRVWLKAAVEEKAMSKETAAELWTGIWKSLTDAGREQREHQGSLHPVDHFIELLRSSLVSGRANLQTIEGDQPPSIGKLCGWRDGKPNGECIGWADEEILYLELDTAYGAANAQGLRNGEGLAVTKRTLVKRLEEREMIVVRDEGRGFRCRTPRTRIPAVAISLCAIFAHAEGGTLPPIDRIDRIDQKQPEGA